MAVETVDESVKLCKNGHERTPNNVDKRGRCHPCSRDRRRRWREKNPDYMSGYWEANRDRLREQQRAYAEAHREEIRATWRKYYEANEETIRERARLWFVENPERARESGAKARHRRRARLAGVEHEEYALQDLVTRDGTDCALCGVLVDLELLYPDPMSRSIDHVVPIVLGGPDTLDNVQLTHLVCNMRKGAKAVG